MSNKPTLRIRHIGGKAVEESVKTEDYFDVVFGTPASLQHVKVMVRDGWIEISVDGQMDIKPVAANCIRIRPQHGLEIDD